MKKNVLMIVGLVGVFSLGLQVSGASASEVKHTDCQVGTHWYYKLDEQTNQMTKAKVVTDDVIHVGSIEMTTDNETIELEFTKEVQFNAVILPADATNKEIIWTSSDERVATVDQNGLATIKDSGIAVITATSVDGNLSTEADLMVSKLSVDE